MQRWLLSMVLCGAVSVPLLAASAAAEGADAVPALPDGLYVSGLQSSQFPIPLTASDGETIYVGATPDISLAAVLGARSGQDKDIGAWVVSVRLDEAGAQSLAAVTQAHVGERLAVVVAGRLVTAPVIRGPITAGLLVISGNFTRAETASLAAALQPPNPGEGEAAPF